MSSIRHRLFVLSLLFLMGVQAAFAQHEYDHWYFGSGAGLDFSAGAPVIRLDGALITEEGSAAISDRHTGELLFYTDGVSVWNREHRLMAGGSGLAGHFSSSQSAVIVPVPCSRTLFRIFTSDAEPSQDPPNTGIHYSTVDMEGDAGRGEVIEKNIPLLATASEKLTAVRHSNGSDYWVIAHSLGGNTFHSFLVTAAGVSTSPINSVAGVDQGNPIATSLWTLGFLKASPDGRRLVQTATNIDLAEIYDFDATTGIVSNAISIAAPGDAPWGACFSPDNNRLYIVAYLRDELLQYTLGAGSPAAIVASRQVVATIDIGAEMAVGPDGRIYLAGWGRRWLGAIDRPNEAGTASGYRDSAIYLGGRLSTTGLANNIAGGLQSEKECPLDAAFATLRGSLCDGGCVQFLDRSMGTPVDWEWSFPGGSPASFRGAVPPPICYPSAGRYTVTLVVRDQHQADTAVGSVMVGSVLRIDAGPDLHLCGDSSGTIGTTLHADDPQISWFWSPATGLSCIDCPSPVARPAVTTTYRVEVRSSDGCVAVDSVRVEVGRSVKRVSISKGHAGEPGDTILIPVLLEDALDGDQVEALTLVIRYDSTMMRHISTRIRTDSMRLAGWTIRVVDEGSGFIRLECSAPAGSRLSGSGPLLALPAMLFLGGSDSSLIDLEMIIAGAECTGIDAIPGMVRLVGCALQTRLIEIFDAKYALAPASPNPFEKSVTISFSTGVPGHVRLTISDESGRHVATIVDGDLDAGEHAVGWNAAAMPAGRYYVMVTSGTWRESGVVIKRE